ncbi:restriction endonuclease [Leptospira santarosai]|uniref:Restriction endonuclease n=2 Tax=Leptospira santarosai TaxID=28183 RepID=A0AB73LKL9_9LEPT|nr:restriction endonuclease [Leptospira santarosai]AVV51172.1 Restriction endonuclease [Leptospira santarosai]ONF91125.1 restriction endonuclease [Leptospira santarosai]
MNSIDNFILAKDLTFFQWLKMVNNEDMRLYPCNCFPTQEIMDKFMNKIHRWPELQIRKVLRAFLVNSGYYGLDETYFESMSQKSKKFIDNLCNTRELYYRMFKDISYAREGITWVLDFLPNEPKKAMKAISLYFESECQSLPDPALSGLSHALSIISARYTNVYYPDKYLKELAPEDFEVLIAHLYSKLDYKVKLTKKSHDAGVDIIALGEKAGRRTKILIQCKRYSKPVPVAPVRELLGVVHSEKANKGIIVSTSNFTKPAIAFEKRNPQIELIDYIHLSKLLAEYFGGNWPTRMQHFIYNIPVREFSE